MFTAFRALTLISTPHRHLFPLLKTPSERSAFPLALRGTDVVFLLFKKFSSELATEAEVIALLLIHDETDAGEPRPGWMRVLAMKIMFGLIGQGSPIPHFWHTVYW
jgi:hypothetical protein